MQLQWTKTLSIISALLLIIFIISAGVYLLTSEGKLNLKKTPPQVSSIIFPTLVPDVTARWQVFKSTLCGFTIKYPLLWTSSEQDNTVRYGITTPCATINSPDGLQMRIDRLSINTTVGNIRIESINDYIESLKKTSTQTDNVTNIYDLTIGTVVGKSFRTKAQEEILHFATRNNNFIYDIHWPKSYNGVRTVDINPVISTLSFSQ